MYQNRPQCTQFPHPRLLPTLLPSSSFLFTGIKKFFCGPESFTPDLSPCVGESPEIKNYFVAAGMQAYCLGVWVRGRGATREDQHVSQKVSSAATLHYGQIFLRGIQPWMRM